MPCPAWLPAQLARYDLAPQHGSNNFVNIGINCHHCTTISPAGSVRSAPTVAFIASSEVNRSRGAIGSAILARCLRWPNRVVDLLDVHPVCCPVGPESSEGKTETVQPTSNRTD